MTPTLYADDYYTDDDGEALLVCVLPRRCVNCWGNKDDCMDCVLRYSHDRCESLCPICEGRGWLYPDPPDWWARVYFVMPDDDWRGFCLDVWRVLGIVENNE